MRIGIIGCGGIGELRAAAIRSVEELQLQAVSDIDEERASRIVSGSDGLFERDWRALVRRSDIDAVIVCTPPDLHAEMSIDALESGKHVLCEKPLARNPEECQSMVQAAKENDRFLATGFNYRFFPSMVKAHELLNSGVVGQLDHIRSYTGYSATEHSQLWLRDAGVMGGGVMRDNGIHLIDLTCWYLGDVADVMGIATNHVWGFEGCEDNGFALIRNAAGNVASLQASWTEWRKYRLLVEIYGRLGCIRTSCFPMLTQVVTAREPGGPTRKRHYRFPLNNVMEHVRSYRWVVVRSFIAELRAFWNSCRNASTLMATGEDGLRAVKIAHAVASGYEPERHDRVVASDGKAVG